MRVEVCHGCGVTIVAPRDDWDAIAIAVWRHNQTDLHVAWRLGGRG